MIKLVTFDVVGTLVKFRGSINATYARVARKHGVDCDVDEISKNFISALKELNTKHPNFGARTNLPSKDWWKICVTNTFIASGK